MTIFCQLSATAYSIYSQYAPYLEVISVIYNLNDVMLARDTVNMI
jgi:hypothetical protein